MICRAQNRAASAMNPRDIRQRQLSGSSFLHQPIKTILEPDARDPALSGTPHDAADNRVQSGGITSARQKSYAFRKLRHSSLPRAQYIGRRPSVWTCRHPDVRLVPSAEHRLM